MDFYPDSMLFTKYELDINAEIIVLQHIFIYLIAFL